MRQLIDNFACYSRLIVFFCIRHKRTALAVWLQWPIVDAADCLAAKVVWRDVAVEVLPSNEKPHCKNNGNLAGDEIKFAA